MASRHSSDPIAPPAARDVARLKEAEAALRESQQRFQAFMDHSPAPAWIVDDVGRLLWCNPAFLRLDSRPAEELRGKTIPEVVPAPYAQEYLEHNRLVLARDQPLEVIESYPRPDGTRGYGLVCKFPIRDAAGRRLVGGVGIDITERRQAEALLAAEARVLGLLGAATPLPEILDTLVRTAEELTDGMLASVLLIEDGRLRHGAAPSLADSYNRAVDGVAIGPCVGSCGTAAYRREPVFVTDIATDPLWAPYREVALAHGLRACWSTPILAGDLVLGTFALYYREPRQPHPFELRLIERMTHLARLAIERKRSEEALRASEERYRAFLAHSSEGIWRFDIQPPLAPTRPEEEQIDHCLQCGTLAECNDALARMYGFSRADELRGSRVSRFLDASDPRNREFLRAFVRSGYRLADAESHEVDRHGNPKYFVNTLTGILENGFLVGAWGMQRDVTERKLLEEQYRQAQKMEAVGRLAGGVAHDFNNLLTVVLGYTHLLLGSVPVEGPARGMVEDIQKAAERATELTRQLLAFGRKQMLQPVVLNLNTVVANTEKILRRLIGEDIQVVTVLEPALHAVKADAAQLGQILLNLAVNARDAMPDGGALTLRTANVAVDENQAAERRELGPGQYVLLAVSDTGCGMDAETLALIFEPFFTTKEVGKGTGLGLATVYGAVKQSGGTIAVRSQVGVGTTFEIYLPAAGEGTTAAAPQTTPVGLSRGTGTVLLVEDEADVRGLARRVLQVHGYTVLEAPDGAAALQLAGQYAGRIHVLLTDVVMPVLSGRALAERLRAANPGLKVLYVSGYTDDQVVHHGSLGANTAFLQKPFTPETLLQRVQDLLGPAGGSEAEPQRPSGVPDGPVL
jgi:PAS domain S-box-containing protein